MATFAMICNNRVIEVLYGLDVAPIWPPDSVGNPVTAVTCSDEATRDWAYNSDTGEVYKPEPIKPEPIKPEPTQLDTIEESQLTIMEALADQYELNEERRIDDLEVQAEIYESILALGGNV